MPLKPVVRKHSPVRSCAAAALSFALVFSAAPAAAQTPADTARRVVIVNLNTLNADVSLSEAAIREAQSTLDTLREGRHLELIPRLSVDEILRQSGFPNFLTAPSDAMLLARSTGSVAAIGVSVERDRDVYRLHTTLMVPLLGIDQPLRAPIEGNTISAVAQSLARAVASDTTIRNTRRQTR
jgi:hypothetical protein